MRHAPKAAWRRGDDPVQRWVKFHVVKAPIARVLPPCVGVRRASNQGAVPTRDVTEPPYVRRERLRKGPASYHPMPPGFLVSTPAGRPNLTLIECPPSESLHRVLPMLDDGLDIIAAESGFATSRMQAHAFHVWRGGRMVRSASAVRGFGENRWRWQEGLPEQEDGGEGQRAMFANAEARAAWMGRAAGAFNRLRKQQGATVEEAVELHDKHDRELCETFGPDADPHPLDAWAAGAAAGFDAAHAETARLRRDAARWTSMRTLVFRLQKLLPDDAANSPPEPRLDGFRRRALAEADATGEAPEAVPPRLFFALCAETGPPVDAAAVVPSMRAAMEAGVAEIASGAQDFANRINADPSRDVSVASASAKDAE